MKPLKLIYLALAALLTMCSCSNDDDLGSDVDLNLSAQLSDKHIKTATLPQEILSYISKNFPNNIIAKAEIEINTNYEVEMNNGTELIFDNQGVFLGIDNDGDNDFGDINISPEDLSGNIRNFISTYFPGLIIEKAEIENNGNLEIDLSNELKIIFDTAGVFLGRSVNNNKNIEVSLIPQVIRDYISTNYPIFAIIEAERNNNNFYEVTLINGIELEFNTEGTFLNAEDLNGDPNDDDGGGEWDY